MLKIHNHLQGRNMTVADDQQPIPNTDGKSSKSGLVALLLCVFLGVFGIHRFYVGKFWTGVLMLLTFGCFGIWSLVDAISIISNSFEDKQGHSLTCISDPTPLKKAFSIILAAITEGLIIISLIIMFAMYLTHDLVKLIEKQLEAARTNDFQGAYSYTSKDFQQSTSLEKFKTFINQYPALREHISRTFTKREIVDHRGRVLGTLTSKDGSVIRVEYLLVKEDNQWKILGIVINPKIDEQNTESGSLLNVNFEASQSNAPAPKTTNDLFVYKDKKTNFSAICLKSWEHGSKRPGSFFCTGKKGTPSYQTFINVHTITAKKPDGHILTTNEYINSVREQILKIDPKAKFLDQGPAELPQNPKEFKGEYLLSTFTYKNQLFKRLEFVVSKDNQSMLYDWSYTSTEDQYNKDLPYAKKLYEAMTIQ